MSLDSYNASITDAIFFGAMLRKMTPEERVLNDALSSEAAAAERLRTAKEELAEASTEVSRCKAVATKEREARLMLCTEAERLLTSEKTKCLEKEALRVAQGSEQRKLLTRLQRAREAVVLLSHPEGWETWAEKKRVTATKRKSWWQDQSAKTLIRRESDWLLRNVNWLQKRVLSAPTPRTDFLVLHERGQGKMHRRGWVITSSGELRSPDEVIRSHHHPEAERWYVNPEELALLWEKRTIAEVHDFTVMHYVNPTVAQIETICVLLDKLEKEWQGRRGFSSGIESPSVGAGWCNAETGETLSPGFCKSDEMESKLEPDPNSPFAILAKLQGGAKKED